MAVLAGGAALGSIGSGLLTGILGSNAAKSAASAETNAISQGLQFTQGVYNQASGNLQPYATAGQSALPYLLGFYGLPGGNANGAQQTFQQFTGTPSYQFPLQQGNLALNRQLAASGLIGSGAALKDAVGYNQGYASQGLGTYLQGLAGIAGSGQTAGAQLGQIGNTSAGLVNQAYTNIGNAQAGGIVGSANAWSQGLGQILGAPQLTGNGSLVGNGLASLGNAASNWFGGGLSAYTGPTSGSLIGGPGNPSYLQGQLGLGSNQYVP